jgi:hypothetical protein
LESVFDEGSEEDFIQSAITSNLMKGDELECRLAIAQILKDVNFPHEPVPAYVVNAIRAILENPFHRARPWVSEEVMLLFKSLSL